MAPPPHVVLKSAGKTLRRTKNISVLVLLVLLVLCIVFAWDTRDAMLRLPFLAGSGRAKVSTQTSLVDVSPWQTAQALRALAATTEEIEFAREAQRLADHEVDQAFAAALREATIQAERTKLSGRALELSQRVDELQALVNQDKAQADQLTTALANPPSDPKKSSEPQPDETDLDIAKAQLRLDSDQLGDAQQDLAHASGDNRAQIQDEHDAREAAMRKYDTGSDGGGQIAVIAASRVSTLADRLGGWFRQRSRYQLLQQAKGKAEQDMRALTDKHNALEARTSAPSAGTDAQDRIAKLAAIKDREEMRQLLSLYNDRIQIQQELAAVYGKWSDQVLRQHRIILHLILQSTALILFVLICMILGSSLVRRLMSRPWLGRRQSQTMRMILELSVQVVGVMMILFVVFGVPHETPTILGLATAALTIALQDFIIAFLGWFRLVGKRGIRVGDLVEINGVGGEVVEVGLMTTTLIETGDLGDRGHPTGRRVTFMNGFAIRGVYFNFSTTGQWTWDQITVSLPVSVDAHAAVERILQAVQEETGENSRVAEKEWQRGTPEHGHNRFRTDPAVNLRPSGSGVDLEVRYVARAAERSELRDRLYRKVLGVLQEPALQVQPASAP